MKKRNNARTKHRNSIRTKKNPKNNASIPKTTLFCINEANAPTIHISISKDRSAVTMPSKNVRNAMRILNNIDWKIADLSPCFDIFPRYFQADFDTFPGLFWPDFDTFPGFHSKDYDMEFSP